jgi:hypothetical protein
MEQDLPSRIQDATALDILRYRYHHGPNFGNVYITEATCHHPRFWGDAEGASELEYVTRSVNGSGIEATKTQFEEAWEAAVSDEEIEWLKNEAKCESFALRWSRYKSYVVISKRLAEPSRYHNTSSHRLLQSSRPRIHS